MYLAHGPCLSLPAWSAVFRRCVESTVVEMVICSDSSLSLSLPSLCLLSILIVSMSSLRTAYHKSSIWCGQKFRNCYRYDVLAENHIRLLKIFPGDPDDPICCSLHTVNLLDYDDVEATSSNQLLPSFDAISYVWGYPKFNCKIRCRFTFDALWWLNTN